MVGNDVKNMIGCIFGNVVVFCLMKDGVIVDYEIIVMMMKYYIN